MKIITLEEHIMFPSLTRQIPEENIHGNRLRHKKSTEKNYGDHLADIKGERLETMDANGITMQVLSVAGPGADLLPGDKAPAFAKMYNDEVAHQIADYPDRFAAFAHLPLTAPHAAAHELERTVQQLKFKGALINGLTNDEFLDNEKYAPLLKKAQELGVPIYLHPGLPPETVASAYYSGLTDAADTVLSTAGWGWHSESAIHILRLIISGTLDNYSGLQLIIGHMGEMLPMMMARCDNMFRAGQVGKNKRSVIQTLREQVNITTSGIFTMPPLQAALDTFGIDRILFSIDYPFSANETGKKYLDSLSLPAADLEKLAHGNAEKLLKL